MGPVTVGVCAPAARLDGPYVALVAPSARRLRARIEAAWEAALPS
ncbi:hypothetical protein [Streptomyces sp. NBC_01013]|nr:hypothetical protein OG538_11210 [Streptomyces sp. NBC_01013]